MIAELTSTFIFDASEKVELLFSFLKVSSSINFGNLFIPGPSLDVGGSGVVLFFN